MDVNIFEALEWTQWKTLSLELKTQVMNQVLKYFVSPLKKFLMLLTNNLN
ncbi:hypothetical protein GCM10025857_58230 [Alicyclobacillus contaminans]|nr:hypothetical protein GCM10025857_58230 [Alicyclobacillus contaminans]